MGYSLTTSTVGFNWLCEEMNIHEAFQVMYRQILSELTPGTGKDVNRTSTTHPTSKQITSQPHDYKGLI